MSTFLTWAGIALGVIVLGLAAIGYACARVAGHEPHYDEWPDPVDVGLAILAPDHHSLPVPEDMS